MQKSLPPESPSPPRRRRRKRPSPSSLALSFAHLLNDMMQSLLPAIYPIIKDAYGLDFGQIGLITLAFQLTASLLQPVVGMYTDRRPQPYSLVVGMGSTLVGLIVLAHAGSLRHAADRRHADRHRLVDLPSRIRRAWPAWHRAAGTALPNRVFQVGGQAGQALGPLLAAFIVVPRGQASISWFSLFALLAMVLLLQVGRWYKRQSPAPVKPRMAGARRARSRPQTSVVLAVAILVVLMFSKSAYTASSELLLHLLPDRDVLGLGAGLASPAVPVPGRAGAGLADRRASRRPLRPPRDHLVLDPGRGALHARVAVRQPVLDGRPHHRHRHDHGERLPGHPGLRAGAAAGQGRHDRRPVLRGFLRPRRDQRGPAGGARRRHQHRHRLPDLRLPAAARPAHLVPAADRATPHSASRPPARSTG